MTISTYANDSGYEHEIADQHGNIITVVTNFVMGIDQLVRLAKELWSMATTIWSFIVSLFA